MKNLNLFDFYKTEDIEEKNSLLIYRGMINQEVLNEFGGTIKTSLSFGKQSKKIFSVFVEMAQNIIKFSKNKCIKNDFSAGGGIIIFQIRNNHYSLSSGNLSSKENIDRLIHKCEYLSDLNKEELKNHYQNVIRESSDSQNNGLGLIDIFRKIDYPIKTKVIEVDEHSSFITLTTMFKSGDKE